MPEIKDFALSPAETKISVGKTKQISATVTIKSSRKFSLTFTLSDSHNYVLVNASGAETKSITFANFIGETIGDIVVTKALLVKLKSKDDSLKIGITAQVEDSVPSQSLPRIKFLTIQ